MMEAKNLFCAKCGKQLSSIYEMDRGQCFTCFESIKQESNQNDFLCWSCGKSIASMNEIAQGVCHNCKAAIIRKLR
jgi:DNA-directed RNA polymerase subunit RPC12/RpoP